MKRDDFKIDLQVTVAECYLSDEASPDCASETATVFTEPSDDEELVGIRYEDGSLDYVPQNILEIKTKTVCKNCGSEDVEIRGWVNLKTGTMSGETGEDKDTYCNSCEQHAGVEDKNI